MENFEQAKQEFLASDSCKGIGAEEIDMLVKHMDEFGLLTEDEAELIQIASRSLEGIGLDDAGSGAFSAIITGLMAENKRLRKDIDKLINLFADNNS